MIASILRLVLVRDRVMPLSGIQRLGALFLVAACPSVPGAWAEEPVAPVAVGETLAVYPTSVHLTTCRDRQSVIVQATSADGVTRDVTGQAMFVVEHPDRVAVEGGMLRPLADGDTTLKVAVGEKSLTIPVHVERSGEDPPLSFRLDIMPVFMRAGCNTGSCHGAARGKDGFRLSLFGFDPDGDHHRLTREFSGRRLNLAIAEESLLMEKSINAVPHSGGGKIKKGDEYYTTLVRWLEAGAANDPGPVPAVIKVEIDPPTAVLDGEGATQKFIVRAKYADGTDRDVTNLAVFSSNNDNSAVIVQDGTMTAKNRGEAFIMARYDTHTVGSHVIVLPKGLVFQWSNPPANNYVDQLVNAKLLKLRINPSELCSDDEFIRRVSLDICGTLPTSDELQSFLASADPAKREHLVDSLLERKEFVVLWVMKWSELLMIRTSQLISYKAMLPYYN